MSVEQFQDGGSLRSMHQGGVTFCHPFLGKWGCESQWNPSQNENAMWWCMFITAAGIRLAQEVYKWSSFSLFVSCPGTHLADTLRNPSTLWMTWCTEPWLMFKSDTTSSSIMRHFPPLRCAQLLQPFLVCRLCEAGPSEQRLPHWTLHF